MFLGGTFQFFHFLGIVSVISRASYVFTSGFSVARVLGVVLPVFAFFPSFYGFSILFFLYVQLFWVVPFLGSLEPLE